MAAVVLSNVSVSHSKEMCDGLVNSRYRQDPQYETLDAYARSTIGEEESSGYFMDTRVFTSRFID